MSNRGGGSGPGRGREVSVVTEPPAGEELRRLGFETAPVPLLLVDGQGRILAVNNVAATMAQASPQALVGASMQPVLHGPGAGLPCHPARGGTSGGGVEPEFGAGRQGGSDHEGVSAADWGAAGDAGCEPEGPSEWVELENGVRHGATERRRDPLAGMLGSGAVGSRRAGVTSSGVELVWIGPLGDRRRFVWTLTSLAPGVPDALLLTGVDVTEHRAREATWQTQAQTDPLTGLANRAGLQKAMAEHLHPQRGLGCGLLFCDLDGFKQVNDVHGHAIGDRLLVHVATKLRACARQGDLIARVGGDEFVVVLPGAGRVESTAAAMRMEQLISRPVRLEGTAVRIGISVGVRIAEIGEDAELVLQDADAAMYAVKSRRRGVTRTAG